MKYYLVTRSFGYNGFPEDDGYSYTNYPLGIYTDIEEAVNYVRSIIYDPKYLPSNEFYHISGCYSFVIYTMENNDIRDTIAIPVLDENYILTDRDREYYEKFVLSKNMTGDEFIKAFHTDNPVLYEVMPCYIEKHKEN